MTILAFWNSADHVALLGWGVVMLLLAAGVVWFYLGYQRDGAAMSRSAHTRKWWANMRAVAFLTGITWGGSALLTCMPGSTTFSSACFTCSALACWPAARYRRRPCHRTSPMPRACRSWYRNLLMAEIAFPAMASTYSCCWSSMH
ncbi:hypothetical protein ACTMU2_38170 [Cupriavidus basilensis]